MSGKKSIRITYEIWDQEAAEVGDTDQRGFVDEEGESMMPGEYFDDQGSAVDNAIHYLRQHGPALEPSESGGRGAASRWYTDHEYRDDFRTGEKEQRSYHLHGFSEPERRRIQKAMEKKSYRSNAVRDDETPITNASDANWIDELFLMWIGGKKVYVWANSFDDAFEEMVEWADDKGLCGVFTYLTEDDLREAAEEIGVPWPGIEAMSGFIESDAEKVLQQAEMGLTSIGHTTLRCERDGEGKAYVADEDWGGREVTSKSEYNEVRRRSLAVPIPLGYDVLNVFQQYWTGQGDPLYAVLSRRGTSVDWVTVYASPEEVERLQEVAEEILEDERSSRGERATAKALLGQLSEL